MQAANWSTHGSVRGRPRLAARHAAFVRQHVVSGALGLAAALAFVVATGVPSLFAAGAFALLAATGLAGLLLRATGWFEAAFALSSLIFALLVGWLCLWTGGVESFVLVWLALVPVEAAMSASRRNAALAAFFSVAVFGGLVWLSLAGGLPAPHMPSLDPFLVRMISIAAAILYAGALAMRAQAAFQQAHEAADSEEARYRMVADNASDLITRHAIDGTVLFATPACRRLLGMRPSQLLGTRYQDLSQTQERDAVTEAMRDALRQGGEASALFTVDLPSGVTRQLEARFRATGGRGEISLVGVTRDVTDRQTAADQMAAARDLAEQANRTKSAFLRSMSHELRTPLNAIIGFAQIIRAESFGPLGNPRYADCADTIGESGKALLQVVTDVLRMSEIEAGDVSVEIEETSLPAVARNAVEHLAPRAAKAGISIDVLAEDGLPLAMADARAASQALRNILSNAVDHSPGGARVTVSGGFTKGTAWLEVADTGSGIPAADLERVTRAFERSGGALAGRPAGAGVGLSVARALMELQNGRLELHSVEGEGTQVRLVFPRAAARNRLRAI